MIDQLTKRLGWTPKRIAVFRALQLGDLLVTVPFFRALRRAFPAAEITLLGIAWARTFAKRYSRYIDAFIEFPGYPGLPECTPAAAQFDDFLRRVRSERFDVALQIHGSGRISNRIIAMLGARATGGFYEARATAPDYDLFAPYPDGHEIIRSLRLLDFLGLPRAGAQLEFPLTACDRREATEIRRRFNLRGNYLCIHAGARYTSRRWPTARFAELADRLFDDGFHIALTGSCEEEPLVAQVSRQMSRPHSNLTGQTTLGALGAILQRSPLVVTGDTGASHVAAAVGAPSVVIVLGSDPARWAPLNRRRHAIVLEPIDCRPCDHRDCPIGHPCATSLSVQQVLETARRQLHLHKAALSTSLAVTWTGATKDLDVTELSTDIKQQVRKHRDGRRS